MRLVARAALAGGIGFAVALLVAACGGSSGLLSGDQANTLNGQLNQLASAVGSHNCGAAQSASQNFASAVAGLPQSVNSTVRANLNQGASTVTDLAARDCQANTTPTTPTATTATATTQATSQQTTTTQATTTRSNPPPTTTRSNPPPTTPSGGGGGQNGGGGGGQNGGGGGGQSGGSPSGGGGLSGGGNGQ